MAITFTIAPINGGTGVTLTNTLTGYTLLPGHTLTLKVTGTLNGLIGSLLLTAPQIVAYSAKTPVVITASVLTAGTYTSLPDDFYKVQLVDMNGVAIAEVSDIMTLATKAYVQKSIHDKIVRTDRLIGFIEKESLHELFIHLRALEILGVNPPLSMEDTVVARITYLKTR